jgi:hypothetical protein
MTHYKHLRGLPLIDIREDWSPEQALAADELLEQLSSELQGLRERIWLLYGSDIQDLLRNDIVRGKLPRHHNDEPF